MPNLLDALHLAGLTAAMPSPAEGDVAWRTDQHRLHGYDSVQEIAIGASGWCPYAFPLLFTPGNTANSTLALAVVSAGVGGGIAIPMWVPGHMLAESITYMNGDASGAHTLEARLYRDRLNNANAIDFITGTDCTFSFTPSAADIRTSGNFSAAPVYIAPGVVWLVLRNTSASVAANVNTFNIPSFGTNAIQTKNIAALGSTIDMVAATWNKNTKQAFARINGRAFGQSSAF